MPLSTDELIKVIETNQSSMMFEFQGHIVEQILRNSSGELAHFGKALLKYPPAYADNFNGLHYRGPMKETVVVGGHYL